MDAVSQSPGRYDELLQRIGTTLIAAAREGWRRIDLVARLAEEMPSFSLTVIMSDLSLVEENVPAPVVDDLVALRAFMSLDRSAWTAARYVLNAPDEFRIFYRHPQHPLPDRTIPLGIEGQRDLTRAITDVLVQWAPADRDQIRVVYRATGHHVELVGHILGIDGQLREWNAPDELLELFRHLRGAMYADGVGVWTAASLVVEWPIRTSIRYLSTEDPRWRQLPPSEAVLDELSMYPRAPELVPGWMATVLATT